MQKTGTIFSVSSEVSLSCGGLAFVIMIRFGCITFKQPLSSLEAQKYFVYSAAGEV